MSIADLDTITRMPKLEMHIHLEGTIPTEFVLAKCAQYQLSLPRPIEHLYVTDDLSQFLATLDWVCALVRSEEDALELAWNFGRYCVAQNIVYTEVIVNPTHWQHLPFARLLPALALGFEEVQQQLGPDIRLLPSILRNQSAEEAEALVQWMAQADMPRIVGLSIDGNEKMAGRTGPRFAKAYQLAREHGLGCTAHAGESSGAAGVADALEYLGVSRIDHGVRAVEQPELMQRLVRDKITLNICLSSNCALMYESVQQHPILELDAAGVAITLNTDDPVVLDKTLCQELHWAAQQLQWPLAKMVQLQRNAVNSAFCDALDKQRLHAQLDAFAREFKLP